MITTYNLINIIIRPRNRSNATSINIFITRSIFRPSPRKKLPIPVAINAYNRYIGGVDIANQYRATFTTLQYQNNRY